MFFEETRILAVREMILADDEQGRRAALAKLLPMQRARFRRAVRDHDGPAGDDPPARSAAARVPAAHRGRDRGSRARDEHRSAREAAPTARRELHEFNPMLGFRGCRLGDRLSRDRRDAGARDLRGRGRGAASAPARRSSPKSWCRWSRPRRELDLIKARDRRHGRRRCAKETGVKLDLSGRHHDRAAARRADGRRDRRDRRVLLVRHQRPDPDHLRHQPRRRRAASSAPTSPRAFCAIDPFVSRRRDGVGELVKIGVERGRKTRPDIKLGICGEHGGDPASVAFCHEVGLDYVSCSPYRVPIARLAAAQAALGKAIERARRRQRLNTVIARSLSRHRSIASHVIAKRRSNPEPACGALDCFAALAMTPQALTTGATQTISSPFPLTRYLPLSFERAVYQAVSMPSRANARESLRVAAAHHRLTPSQPKFDNNKKDRIARMY